MARQDDARKFIGARRDPQLHTEYDIALHAFEAVASVGGSATADPAAQQPPDAVAELSNLTESAWQRWKAAPN